MRFIKDGIFSKRFLSDGVPIEAIRPKFTDAITFERFQFLTYNEIDGINNYLAFILNFLRKPIKS